MRRSSEMIRRILVLVQFAVAVVAAVGVSTGCAAMSALVSKDGMAALN